MFQRGRPLVFLTSACIRDYLVNEGTGAMRAYQDMLYGLAKNDPVKMVKLRDALLTYCKLDTLAMVVIWEHWRGM